VNKAKELLNKLKEFVSLHKVVCLSAAGAVCAVAVTGIVVAVVLGNHSKADTVAGVETAQEETMQTIVMATVEEVTEETTAQTEAEEETETDVIETDSSLEFEYDGKKIVISADKPVELIPEEDLADKIIEDDSTTEIGADVDVDEPDSGNSKVNEPEKNYDIIVDNVDKTVYDVILRECSIEDAIIHNVYDNLDELPSNVNLAGAEIDLIDVDRREYVLKDEISKVRKKYDYIIMDCPPSLSMLTVNAMTAADTVLVPIQCEYYALEGLSQLMYTINLAKKKLNKKLEMEGVVFTMFDARTNLSLQVVENVKDNLKQNVYKTIIPRNIRLAEAPSYGKPINLYDTKSTGAESYRLLAQEVMDRDKKI